MYVLLKSKNNLKDNIKCITILDDTIMLYDEALKDFKELIYITFPPSLKII